jgi:hypothetical protein
MVIYKRYKKNKIKARRGDVLEDYIAAYQKTVPEIVEYLVLVKVYYTDIMFESEWVVMVEDTVPEEVMEKAQKIGVR